MTGHHRHRHQGHLLKSARGDPKRKKGVMTLQKKAWSSNLHLLF
jgi:hypothetical protein